MQKSILNDEIELSFEKVIDTNRVAKVIKGGRHFSFNATVVVGNKHGKIGIGMGKANEVISAINKAKEIARENTFEFPLRNGTIPHSIIGKFCGSKVILKPASLGTGIIAGGPIRAMLEVAGVENVLTKSLGSSTKHNIVKATVIALKSLRSHKQVAKLRNKTISELLA
ncbi:MAG: 30S ribosomal protein S5 [Candidatus Cloacimonetes bacterium]|nr:30S ribosomal protein S5 [Candidatus Cloacimonadota bacterium]MBL7085531.1 30S ribosomal protein S5 [Candidatus Cloacimonadota bacterium]